MNRVRVWHLLVGTATAAAAVAFTFTANLRYSELCFKDDDALTEAQKIDIAIDAILSSYPPSVVKKTWVEQSGRRFQQEVAATEKPLSYSIHKPDKAIGYSGKEEFRKANADCCSVVAMRSIEEGKPSPLSMLFGEAASYVRATYHVRYESHQGTVSDVQYQEFIGISRCGKVSRAAGKTI
jgi:hypothetical protein